MNYLGKQIKVLYSKERSYGFDRCKRCKRPLKNELSIQRGYGATCWKKVQINNQRSVFEQYI